MIRRYYLKSALFCFTATLATLPYSISQEAKSGADGKTVQNNEVVVKDADKDNKDAEKKAKWIPLIERDSLKGWEITNFGGEGSVEVNDGVTRFGNGDPLTGITITRKDFPKENFELRWKAMRVDGTDFFAGVTFPVDDQHCSFIAGGWGGGLVGLSSINGSDASENETSGFHQFKSKQWYSFRVRVDKKHITAWIDEKEILKVEREKGKFGLRAEVLKSRPLGYCVFQSIVDLKEWEYQLLD